MWKEYFKDYFSFTRKERIGVILLLAAIFIITVIPLFFPLLVKEDVYDHEGFMQEIEPFTRDSASHKAALATYNDFDYNDVYGNERSERKSSLFYFDPNKATLQDWVKLGVKERTATTILKYVAKGGKFYKPEDIQKIYGLSKKEAERLIPYIRIENKTKAPAMVSYEKNSYPEAEKQSFPSKKIMPININTADTLTFALLPGIGNRLANRIINFRNRLGGFHSVDQVGETYLLPDSTFQKIKSHLFLEKADVKIIDINQAGLEELKAHPYIRFQVANALVQYRMQHGNFKRIEDVKKIMIVSDSIFNKIAPYISAPN